MCLYSRSILNVSLIGISGQFMLINSDESHIPVSGKQRITRLYVLKRERQATREKTATRDLKVICLRHPPIKQVTTFSVVSSLTPEPQAWEYSTRSGASLRFVQGFRERPRVVPAPGVVFWSMRVELNHCHSCVIQGFTFSGALVLLCFVISAWYLRRIGKVCLRLVLLPFLGGTITREVAAQ